MKDLQQLLQTVKAAASVYVYNLAERKEVFSIKAEESFPAASVNKLPVVIYALDQVCAGKLTLNQEFSVTENILQGSGVIKDLSHTHYTLSGLIYLTMTVSDNSAAKTLVQNLGAKNINEYLFSLGLRQTGLKLENESFAGWGMTSAKDQSVLMQKLYEVELLNSETTEYLLSIMKKCDASARLGRYINIDVNKEGHIDVAYKGGTLPKVRNAVSLFFSPEPITFCIMVKDIESSPSEIDEVMSRIAEGLMLDQPIS